MVCRFSMLQVLTLLLSMMTHFSSALLVTNVTETDGINNNTITEPTEEAAADDTDAAAAPAASTCVSGIREFDPFQHKSVYRVGVQAIRGLESAYIEYNKVFGEYLTISAGRRFDPPITFEMVPYTYEGMFQAIDNKELDFFYSNSGVYSCVGTEVGATPLATIISRLEVRGKVFELDVVGGVMAVRADNNEINNISDLKDKIIGAGDINHINGGQLQFYTMGLAGMSYVSDPKQVIFTGNQNDVVAGLLNKDFDVGFVRTDTIERWIDAQGNGTSNAQDVFKVIEPKLYVMDDGNLFPFLSSTQILPEWPVAALPNVHKDVVAEVQEALLHIGKHAEVGQNYEKCLAAGQENTEDLCDSLPFPDEFAEDPRCDTTKEIARSAWEATLSGSFAGFRTPRSYFELRGILQDGNFMEQDENGDWRCTRASTVYEGITCPEGHHKRAEAEYDQSCAQAGLECKEGWDCFCRPCVKAFEVSVYPVVEGVEDPHLVDNFITEVDGCPKMTVCGMVEQTKSITFRAFDTMAREGVEVTVLMHSGDTPKWLPVKQVPGEHAYDFTISERHVGIEVFEVYINGEQISQSPLRVDIIELDCDETHGAFSNREANSMGKCVCASDTYAMMNRCVKSPFLIVMIFSAVFVVLLFFLAFYLNYKRNKSDSVWHVNVDELVFDDPPKVIGQGGFGVVILGQYRGTRVAVKRVIPPRPGQTKRKSDKASTGDSDETKTDSNKLVRFNSDDIEAAMPKRFSLARGSQKEDLETPMAKRASLTKHGGNEKQKNAIKMSGSNSFDQVLVDQNFSSVIKMLESSTMNSSSEGRSRFLGQNTLDSSRANWWPYWLRFDEHSRLTREFVQEMRLLSRLRHPCITTVMGAVVAPVMDPMLVMEYMDYGSLYDVLHNETMYTGGETILQIVRDVSQGIRFLHASKPPILHGDLKSKNILVDSRFRAKVADFGLSHLKASTTGVVQGTPFFMAPEYLRRRSEYTTACDMYSLGMIFYEIYARKDPFEGEDPNKILPKVCHPRVNLRPPVPESCPPKMTDIMKKLWSANPFFRPAAKDLDYILMDINPQEAQPLEKKNQAFVDTGRANKTAKELLYDVFPKHVADALNAGQRVEPETHDLVTVFFSDIVGFTDISSTFSPMKVSTMLDRLYRAFDMLSKKHNVFKVETIGDSWMGVCNLDGSQSDNHVKNIAEFSLEAIRASSAILVDEEEPERGCIQIRVGFHSGPVVSNVIGTLNPRYGLFGDTVNMASRMESNSMPGKILCSEVSSSLLEEQAPEIDVIKRGKINVKGKGRLSTFWVGTGQLAAMDLSERVVYEEAQKAETFHVTPKPDTSDRIIRKKGIPPLCMEETATDIMDNMQANKNPAPPLANVSGNVCVDDDDVDDLTQDGLPKEHSDDTHETESNLTCNTGEGDQSTNKLDNLIDWDVNILTSHLQLILAKRAAQGNVEMTNPPPIYGTEGKTVLDEFQDRIKLPAFDFVAAKNQIDPKSIDLDPQVLLELRDYVSVIASLYRPHPFHNFEHANHVLVATSKLLRCIVMPHRDGDNNNDNGSCRVSSKVAEDLHRVSCGIASDPLAQFACIFGAMIHDLDHPGVANAILVEEKSTLAQAYKNKSVAEQNSVDLAWEILMTDRYKIFRKFAFANEDELMRFRQILVNMVMATDIMDKDLGALRSARWDKVFSASTNENVLTKDNMDLKATVVMERLLQISDVSHTMQQWHIYKKWNERLFFEMYGAYQKGRLSKDPSECWYQGEMGFFDFYIIPQAKKLDACGVFGDLELAKYAIANRKEWELQGEEIVAGYKQRYHAAHPFLSTTAGARQSQEQEGKKLRQRALSLEWGDASAGELPTVRPIS